MSRVEVRKMGEKSASWVRRVRELGEKSESEGDG